MFIFSRDFSHPRQKISAKYQPFSNSKVHFNHSPIRQKNYKMSNTFYKISHMISTFCHLATTSPPKNGCFLVAFCNLQRVLPKQTLRFNAPTVTRSRTWLQNFVVPLQLACCQLRIPSQPISNSRPSRRRCCCAWMLEVVVDGEIPPRFREISSVRNGWWLNQPMNGKMCCLSNLFRNFPKVFWVKLQKIFEGSPPSYVCIIGLQQKRSQSA